MRDSTKARVALMEQENGVTEFQCQSRGAVEWRDCNNPLAPVWESPNTTFRVKPKPIELWVWKYLSSGLIGQDFFNKKQPDDTDPSVRVMILMREVTE